MKIKNKKINFHIFFFHILLWKNVPICWTYATPLKYFVLLGHSRIDFGLNFQNFCHFRHLVAEVPIYYLYMSAQQGVGFCFPWFDFDFFKVNIISLKNKTKMTPNNLSHVFQKPFINIKRFLDKGLDNGTAKFNRCVITQVITKTITQTTSVEFEHAL